MTRILLVDDDLLMTKILSRTLIRAGFEVQVSNRAYGVLNLVASTHPDILVMDMNMPGLRGIEVLDLLRDDPCLMSTKVVFYSGVEEHELRMLATGGGADGYLHKSASPNDLVDMLRCLPSNAARAV
ncbi:MAG: response regulator [Polyangiales bacterium]